MRVTAISIVAVWGVNLWAIEPTPETCLPSHESTDAYTPCAAAGRDIFLIAWQAGRLAQGDLREGIYGAGDIAACRVDGNGAILDPEPFLVSGAKDLQERPMMVFGGDVFMIVWQDIRNDKDYDTFAARVTPDGKVLDPEGILVSGGPHNQCNPRVAWDGNQFVVVWQDFRSNRAYECFGARVSADGKVLDSDGILLVSGGGSHRHVPAIASAGQGKSFILWARTGGGSGPIAGGLFFQAGTVTQGPSIQSNAGDHGPGQRASPIAVAAGLDAYLTTWTTSTHIARAAKQGDSSAAIFGKDGSRLKNLYLAGKEHYVLAPEVAWNGKTFVAAWGEVMKSERGKGSDREPHNKVFVSIVSTDGTPSDLTHISGSFESPALEPCVASDRNGTSLIAYERHPETAQTPIKIGFRLLKSH